MTQEYNETEQLSPMEEMKDIIELDSYLVLSDEDEGDIPVILEMSAWNVDEGPSTQLHSGSRSVDGFSPKSTDWLRTWYDWQVKNLSIE